jgi:hypothetical protein
LVLPNTSFSWVISLLAIKGELWNVWFHLGEVMLKLALLFFPGALQLQFATSDLEWGLECQVASHHKGSFTIFLLYNKVVFGLVFTVLTVFYCEMMDYCNSCWISCWMIFTHAASQKWKGKKKGWLQYTSTSH